MEEKPSQETITIIIDEEFISLFGDNSLSGYIVNNYLKSLMEIKTIILKFPRSSDNYCEKKKGPKELIIVDFNIPCLLKDLLSFIERGVKIKIETFITDYDVK